MINKSSKSIWCWYFANERIIGDSFDTEQSALLMLIFAKPVDILSASSEFTLYILASLQHILMFYTHITERTKNIAKSILQ